MTPTAIAAEAEQAGLRRASTSRPARRRQADRDGAKARCFASYMRIHALEATGGQTYAQMPRYATADGKGTNDAAAAQKEPQAASRWTTRRAQVWVNETALSTALNASYMADQIALFGIVVGIALLLSGVGFGVLAAGGGCATARRRSPRWAARSSAPDTSRRFPTA